MSPWERFSGTHWSKPGEIIRGWNWRPSGKYRKEHDQLVKLMDEYIAEKDKQFKELGWYTTTKTYPKIADWLDTTIDHYRYNGQTWWQRNWFPLIMLAMMGGSMLVIGLVNGWS